ncbi:MAG: ATP-binding protein [Pseudonocardia sp.]
MTAALRERPAVAMSEPEQPEWQQASELVLAALPSAVNCARLLVCSELTRYPLDRRCIDAAEQVMDELVTHAVKTTGVTADQPMYRAAYDHLGTIRVLLRLMAESLVIEVWDSSTEPPESSLGAAPGLSRSRDWSYHLPRSGGRVVWCVLSMFEVQPDTVQFPALLPQRVRQGLGNQSARIMRDPVVLQRVLDGLNALGPRPEPEDPC